MSCSESRAHVVWHHGFAAIWITALGAAEPYPVPMVQITIERRWGGYTFLVNGRDDVVVDPEWGVTTFGTERAAFEAAVAVVRALRRAGERRADLI